MRPVHHHVIQANLNELLPTQATIGFVEVAQKRAQWQALGKKERKSLINTHWFPSVIGPAQRHYIIDHHHLGMALHLEGQTSVQLTVLKDLSWLDLPTFWRVMEFHQWVHPYDQNGERMTFARLPTNVADLADDPYRSLAGLARMAGAFAKDITPFSEFLWADYFRSRLHKKLVKKSPNAVLEQACDLAKHIDASYLPGWVGKAEA